MKLKLADKITIIVASCLVVAIIITVVVGITRLINAYVIADEKLSTGTNYIKPYTRAYTIIDCETEMIEGDIKNLSELYDPFGNWRAISLENVSYQLKHGGRLVKCK